MSVFWCSSHLLCPWLLALFLFLAHMNKRNEQVEIVIPDKNEAAETSMQKKLSEARSLDSKCCIYKVPEFIKKGKQECYEPKVVSIGPAYYKDPKLKSMQQFKWNILDSFLQHPKNSCRTLDRYINIIKELNDEIRDCYDQLLLMKTTLSNNDDNDDEEEFIEVMVLDAIFLLSVFMKPRYENQTSLLDYEPNFQPPNKFQVLSLYIGRDILLEENQLPFFILGRFFTLAFPTHTPSLLIDLARRFIEFQPGCPGSEYVATSVLIRDDASNIAHLIDLWRRCCCLSLRPPLRETKPVQFPKTAKQLTAAGVKFVRSESTNPLCIEFDSGNNINNGELRIPRLTVHENTEAFLRNFLHFEQCHYYFTDHAYFIDLIYFLDSLIDSAEDVRLLEKNGVLNNLLGSDQKAANLFNNITTDVWTKPYVNSFAGISKEVNEYANKSWNRWMAIMRRDYFRHPWAIISFIFAIVLFVLTFIQTVIGFTNN